MARILIVDDLPAWLERMKAAAAGPGREVDTANSAEDAAAKILAAEFDVVVTDLGIPPDDGVEGGFKVLRAAKQKDVYTQVIVCTAAPESVRGEIGADAMRLGAFDYIRREAQDHLEDLKIAIDRAMEFRILKQSEGKER